MITQTLNELIVARLATGSGPMQLRKMALLKTARAAFPSIAINEALWQYIIGAAPPTGGYANIILAANPIAYFRCDETGGVGAMLDSSPNAHHGAYVAGKTLGLPGATSDGHTAVGFNGTADARVDWITAYNALGDGPASIECFYKRNGPPTTNPEGILSTYEGSTQYPFSMLVTLTGRVNLFRSDGVTPDADITSVRVVTDNAWHHIAATFSVAGINLYIDGALDRSVAYPANDCGVAVAVCVGSENHNAKTAGLLDEIAFYAYALTGAQIAAHSNGR